MVYDQVYWPNTKVLINVFIPSSVAEILAIANVIYDRPAGVLSGLAISKRSKDC